MERISVNPRNATCCNAQGGNGHERVNRLDYYRLASRLFNRLTLYVLVAVVTGFVLGAQTRLLTSAGNGEARLLLADTDDHIAITTKVGSLAGTMSNPDVHLKDQHSLIQSTRAQTKHLRIFCWILTNPSNHRKKARHVRDTWARRCDKFVFVSSENDPKLPAINLGAPEGYEFLWAKTKAAFRYAYVNHIEDFDYFLKADDDTYVVIENLRQLLRDTDPREAIYVGRRFRWFSKQGFPQGGAGYALSKEALRRFVEVALEDKNNKCPKDDLGPEDVKMGMCLENVQVTPIDTRDELGRERFHPFPLDYHLLKDGFDKDHYIWKYSYFPFKLGDECCSDTSVSFHYTSPGQMRAIEFLIYRLQLRTSSSNTTT